MDSISSEIRLLFDYQFNNESTEIDQTLLTQKNYKLLADIGGKLDIYLDGIKFFSEDGILLLEFGVQLKEWLNQVRQGDLSNFIYETMSYSEGPLIEFIQDDDSQSWGIYSVWQEFEYNEKIPLEILNESVNCFLIALHDDLIKKYKVNIEWYV
ncbi:MAG: hypothetical protein LLG02_01620 [Pelosinus sp.]|nr:hypothetical protein [Pelosinus sp.]